MKQEYKNELGQLHRVDGPAIEWTDGTKSWWLNGKQHRIDGPAFDSLTRKCWWVNGERHRVDGPAVVSKIHNVIYKEWWLCGTPLTEDLHKTLTQGPVSELLLHLHKGFDEFIAQKIKNVM
jgi:hypothetical protein